MQLQVSSFRLHVQTVFLTLWIYLCFSEYLSHPLDCCAGECPYCGSNVISNAILHCPEEMREHISIDVGASPRWDTVLPTSEKVSQTSAIDKRVLLWMKVATTGACL